ncbi:RNA-binding protein [Mangrovibacterium sp.]|uniref:RNA recognition motif domain-containing protein n=1 Tax=Mangrovibacterium sp. TaxID=1961364 RepID=UPI003568EE6B
MNIYVGNLSYNLSEEEISELFGQFGEVVSVKLVKDRETGRAKGFGFVEMADDQEGTAAIEKLDGADVQGRNIKVNEAKPRENTGFNSRREGGGGGYNRNFGGGDRFPRNQGGGGDRFNRDRDGGRPQRRDRY